MADAWLKRRLGDPRFASERGVTPWHSVGPRFEGEYESYTFAYPSLDDSPPSPKKKKSDKEPEKKKKRKKTESGKSASESSSGSASEGGTKKKKGRCWKGYEPTPGKEPYSEGSCRKA